VSNRRQRALANPRAGTSGSAASGWPHRLAGVRRGRVRAHRARKGAGITGARRRERARRCGSRRRGRQSLFRWRRARASLLQEIPSRPIRSFSKSATMGFQVAVALGVELRESLARKGRRGWTDDGGLASDERGAAGYLRPRLGANGARHSIAERTRLAAGTCPGAGRRGSVTRLGGVEVPVADAGGGQRVAAIRPMPAISRSDQRTHAHLQG